MPENPFKTFRFTFDLDAFVDIAFNKSESKSAQVPLRASPILRARRKEINRIKNVNEYIIDFIEKTVKSVPNLSELHPFYSELADLLVDTDLLKKNLAKLNGLIPVLRKLAKEIIGKITAQQQPHECARLRRQYFARVYSILSKQKRTFKYLQEASEKLRKLPAVDTSLPSVVVAGYPNVGKSSLVRGISTAKPEICPYPFTTKKIIIGVHKLDRKHKLFQIIDTPGILDRPMSRRNEIERQAILALRTVSNIMIFVIDPTLTSGYPVDSQISLFREIKRHFIDIIKIPYFIVINKMDLASPEEINYVIKALNLKEGEYIITNAKDDVNLDKVIDKIKELIETYNLKPEEAEYAGRF